MFIYLRYLSVTSVQFLHVIKDKWDFAMLHCLGNIHLYSLTVVKLKSQKLTCLYMENMLHQCTRVKYFLSHLFLGFKGTVLQLSTHYAVIYMFS